MKALFSPKLNQETTSNRVSTALLLIRWIVGIAMISHGASKIAAPFSWMGADAPVPGILQALAALSEFGGGIALIVGLLTPLALLGLISTMAVAVFFHLSKGDGFVGGYELGLVYLVAFVGLFLTGPGRFSLDAVIAAKRESASTNLRSQLAR
jgi:putative oxidoreductase